MDRDSSPTRLSDLVKRYDFLTELDLISNKPGQEVSDDSRRRET